MCAAGNYAAISIIENPLVAQPVLVAAEVTPTLLRDVACDGAGLSSCEVQQGQERPKLAVVAVTTGLAASSLRARLATDPARWHHRAWRRLGIMMRASEQILGCIGLSGPANANQLYASYSRGKRSVMCSE